MQIKRAEMKDLPQMLLIYERARQFMRETGNPNQWKSTYPPESVVKQGIQEGKAWLCIADGPEDGREGEGILPGEILGTFYFAQEDDPAYHHIEGGSWLNEDTYAVIHRVASSGKGRGFARCCFSWAASQCPNLKIDTHEDNRVMQHVLEKNGFQRCGIIHLADGSPRLAYQRAPQKKNEAEINSMIDRSK